MRVMLNYARKITIQIQLFKMLCYYSNSGYYSNSISTVAAHLPVGEVDRVIISTLFTDSDFLLISTLIILG